MPTLRSLYELPCNNFSINNQQIGIMADIQESLSSIMDLDGAKGAALVDYQSGMTLGTVGGRDVDMELAGAANTEIVRSNKSVLDKLGLDDKIEDILISLEGEYHLIRIFHENENVFTYVILDRDKANLALARMDLQDIDKELVLE
jgi:predicted regulator of Ras-like GTPase activity (Roadblock/LC7/MglB family)